MYSFQNYTYKVEYFMKSEIHTHVHIFVPIPPVYSSQRLLHLTN